MVHPFLRIVFCRQLYFSIRIAVPEHAVSGIQSLPFSHRHRSDMIVRIRKFSRHLPTLPQSKLPFSPNIVKNPARGCFESMLSLHKPRDVLAVPRWVRLPSRLSALGALARAMVYSYAFALLRVWTKPAFMYAAIASCCVVVFTVLSIRSICYSMNEAISVTATINLSIVRTVAHFVFVRGRKQRFANWTLQLEVFVDALRLVTEQCGGRISESWVARTMRNRSVTLGTLDGYLESYLAGGIAIESVKFLGLDHVWLKDTGRNATTHNYRRRVVLFFHGGGFAFASPHLYISAGVRVMTAIRTQLESNENDNQPVAVDLLLANYRKAPEHPFPAAPDDAFSMYKFLLDHEGLEPSQIIIAGDSVGASLALTTLTTIRDLTPTSQPLAGVLICPFVDLDPCMCWRITKRRTACCPRKQRSEACGVLEWQHPTAVRPPRVEPARTAAHVRAGGGARLHLWPRFPVGDTCATAVPRRGQVGVGRARRHTTRLLHVPGVAGPLFESRRFSRRRVHRAARVAHPEPRLMRNLAMTNWDCENCEGAAGVGRVTV